MQSIFTPQSKCATFNTHMLNKVKRVHDTAKTFHSLSLASNLTFYDLDQCLLTQVFEAHCSAY